MTTSGTPDRPAGPAHQPHGGHGHTWMMIACCIPMLLVAAVLVVTGVAGVGAPLAALACTVMMALMMVGTGHGSGEGNRR